MKATIHGVREDELEQVIETVHKFNGQIVCYAEKYNRVVAKFDNDDDIKGFDIVICDFGYDVEWT
ncbi:MAG: hypothetical protein ACYS6K_16055 [Planctomycetota bacterium]